MRSGRYWHAAGKSDAFGLLARLCLLGGSRGSEPSQMQWSRNVMDYRVTFDARWTKMGRHNDIPRAALVYGVLDAERFRGRIAVGSD